MKKHYTVGVLIGNANSPHTMKFMEGIYQCAASMNVNVVYLLGIHSSFYYRSYFGEDTRDDFDYQFNVVYDYADLTDADALIIAYGTLHIFLENQKKTDFLKKFRNKPCILMEDRDEEGKAASVITDNYHGMYALAEHLVKDHGYRQIGYLSGPKGNTDAEERLKAVRDVMQTYQVPFDESHIAYGDFSPCVEGQIQELFMRMPGMDALICANDVMAYTAYQKCAQRGLTPGHDLAITGYDDWEQAENMNPPLTTVVQNSYDMGWMAVIGAVELCRGGKIHNVVVPAQVKIRESCGCSREQRSLGGFTQEMSDDWKKAAGQYLEAFVESVLPENAGVDLRSRTREQLRTLLMEDFRREDTGDYLKRRLQKLLNSRIQKQISMNSLIRSFDRYLDGWIQKELIKDCISREAIQNLLLRKRQIHETVLAYMVRSEKDRFSTFQQESWFLPLISRDMLCQMDSEMGLYKNALIKLQALDAKNSFLYIFEEPCVHRPGDTWKCPEKMYLAAIQEGKEVRAFEEGGRPWISAEHPHSQETLHLTRREEHYASSVFCLFSGEIQYGVLVTEITPEKISLFYLISRQIGNMLRLHQMSVEQQKLQKKLEALVGEVEEKNKVLNFISVSDPLTGCLNRRGFMEKALELDKEYAGQTAWILLGDLDHLKEINDTFGHTEGDFAIRRCASVLKEIAGEKGLVGRIGGDEFCVMMVPGKEVSGEADTLEKIRKRIQALNETFNQESRKPYYVELSIGGVQMVCGSSLALDKVLSGADEKLYEAKSRRRPSSIK